jgi:hypothetical protein
MQHLLAFLVEDSLAGRAGRLKEYTIATSVFGKPADFEPGTSSLVRVEAGRLRRLLMQYRVEYGTANTIVLEIPKGSYVPIFRRLVKETTVTVPESAQARDPDPTSDTARPKRSWGTSDDRRLATVISCAFGNEHSLSQQGRHPNSSTPSTPSTRSALRSPNSMAARWTAAQAIASLCISAGRKLCRMAPGAHSQRLRKSSQ